MPGTVAHALREVRGLAKGRSPARETEPVTVVPEQHVRKVLDLVPIEIGVIIKLQELTGMRPGEVVRVRKCDIAMEGSVWSYKPHRHKTEHHGKNRVIALGPQAQEILKPYLDKHPDGYTFRPRVRPSKAGRYSTDRYARAIARACIEGKVPHWHPNQLRHNFATKVRRLFGLDAVQVALGHSNAQITEVYAEADFNRAQEVALRLG